MSFAVKLTGAALIVFAASRLGGLVAGRFGERRRHLKALADALELLETEVVYGSTPLPRALADLAGRGPALARGFLGILAAGLNNTDDLTVAWRAALDETYATSCLVPADRDALLPLGAVLGRSDRQDQSRHLKAACQRLKQLEAAATLDEERHARLWRSVGTLGGLAIAILFL